MICIHSLLKYYFFFFSLSLSFFSFNYFVKLLHFPGQIQIRPMLSTGQTSHGQNKKHLSDVMQSLSSLCSRIAPVFSMWYCDLSGRSPSVIHGSHVKYTFSVLSPPIPLATMTLVRNKQAVSMRKSFIFTGQKSFI